MRRFLLVALAVGLAAPIALGAATYTNEDLGLSGDDLKVNPGALVLAQKIKIVVTGEAKAVTELTVKNTAGNPAQGAEIEYIEVRRDSGTGPVLRKLTSGLTNFHTTGVTFSTVTTASIRNFAVGTHYLYVLIKLKADVPLERNLALGDTKIESVPITYPPAATVFTVGPSPAIAFDGSVVGANVYRGERFLAGRIEVDAEEVPFETTISRLLVKNVANTDATPLSGSYVAAIEVRRASDGALLGEATSTEIAKLTTTGTAVTTSSNNKLPAYSTVFLEIWVTLKGDAPTGHKLKLQASVRCGGTDFNAGPGAEFTVGQPQGFEELVNLGLTGGRVFSRQRFLAQRIKVVDDDLDPYDVLINSVVVQNVADPATRLADTQIASIEVVRARDGAVMGSVTSVSGLNSGGVRITTGANNVVRDDTSEVIELWVTLKDNVPHGRVIQLRTVVWHTEDTKTFGKPGTGEDPLDGAEFTTGPEEEGAKGFDQATTVEMANRTVFQGVRFLAQRLDLQDDDLDPYDVVITSLMIRNTEAASPLADQHVARIEVRRKSDGKLLGEVTNPVGLSLAGVRVVTAENNVVPDDTSVELQIWVTLKDTSPAGRKLKLETVVWHTEGTATFQTEALAGPATFTTAIGQRPTGVDFSWAPTAPEAGVDVTFTPAAGIADPSGNIANATFHWNFGDGKTAQTKGSAPVTHRFAIGGTFQVTLTVTGEGGLSTAKTRQVDVIGKQPVVDFSFSPDAPSVGREVAFTSNVTDPATPPLTPYTYAWTFGDGGTSTEANPRHTYTAAGTYTVVLTVTNSRGETGRKEKTITVTETPVNRRPSVTRVTVTPPVPEVGQVATFTATATDPDGDPITGYEWDFGDGSAVLATTANTASHTFAASNVFQVEVRARDAEGFGDWFSLNVYVRPKGGALIGTKVLDNPASTRCRIQLFLPQGATGVKIQIFDALGRPVVAQDVTGNPFTWDLTDNAGRRIADGLYVYLVTATVGEGTERSEVGKILVVR
ncbi:PKD domain-containing protein [Candidatus Bipolaricaulota bacterium]|nr:PKD domain-containing protein [Candidatus Bipolaricaulota bacterium]